MNNKLGFQKVVNSWAENDNKGLNIEQRYVEFLQQSVVEEMRSLNEEL